MITVGSLEENVDNQADLIDKQTEEAYQARVNRMFNTISEQSAPWYK